jgi:RimJ/RimL family protein N-acetyltransferase
MNKQDIANYTVAEQLRDQRTVTIRAIRPGDKELLREAFKLLEEHTIYMRFFWPKKELTDQELIQATEIDFIRNVALVACVQENARERIIGIGRYIAYEEPDAPSTAEIAFVVEEDYHGQGIASLLLRHLVAIGREQGISRFVAEVIPANKKMLRVFERAGLLVATKASSDFVHVTMFLDNAGTP